MLAKLQLYVQYLVGVGPGDPYGVEEVLQAMRNWPEVQSQLVRHKSVCVVKQVDVTPGQRTVLLKGQRQEED